MKHIIEHIKENFDGANNVPRDITGEHSTLLKAVASTLIEMALLTKRIPAFIKTKPTNPGNLIYPLKESVIIPNGYHSFKFNEIQLHNDWVSWPSYKGKRLWDIVIRDPELHHSGHYPTHFPSKARILEKVHEKVFYWTLFDTLKDISPYDSAEKVCRFFGLKADPYAIIQGRGKGFKPDIFTEASLREAEYQAIIHAGPGVIITGWYDFRNQYGEVVMRAFECYDEIRGIKIFLSCSSWYLPGEFENSVFPVAYPNNAGQLLLHLEKLTDINTDIVILCDSLKIAKKMQINSPAGVVWTSYLPQDHGKIDWSPLEREERKVLMFICNHSGRSLAEAYIDAHAFATFLKENPKIDLCFIQAQVDYDEDGNGILRENSVQWLESFSDFEAMHEKATVSLNGPEFWEDLQPTVIGVSSKDKEEEGPKEAIQYLLRPCIKYNSKNLFEGPSGAGKSIMAYAMCASIVSGNKLFKNKCWTIPKPNNGYKYRKILYLDYENGQDLIDERIRDIAMPLFPKDPIERKKCKDNLIIEDLSEKCLRCTTIEGRKELLSYIKKAEQAGEPGQPIDVLVLDTYTQLVGFESNVTASKVDDFLREIRKYVKTVLLLHHTDAKGNGRGYKNKLDGISVEMKIIGNDINKKTEFVFGKTRILFLPVDKEPFFFKHVDNGFELIDPKRDYLEEFGQIITAYQKKGYPRNAILEMIRIDRNTYSQNMKRYREKYEAQGGDESAE